MANERRGISTREFKPEIRKEKKTSGMASGKRHEGERRKCGDASRLRARVPRDEARRGRHSALCIFARLLSSSLLSYPRLVVSHALYLDACRRVLAARACSRARASQKYVILLLYIYIYISMCLYLCAHLEVSLPFDRDVWSLVKPFRDPMLRNFVRTSPPLIHSVQWPIQGIL